MVGPELAAMPAIPIEVAHVWDWFSDLSEARCMGMSIEPIAWADLAAFFAVHQVRPQRWELRTLRRLDAAFISSRFGKGKRAVGNAKTMRSAMTGKKREPVT